MSVAAAAASAAALFAISFTVDLLLTNAYISKTRCQHNVAQTRGVIITARTNQFMCNYFNKRNKLVILKIKLESFAA